MNEKSNFLASQVDHHKEVTQTRVNPIFLWLPNFLGVLEKPIRYCLTLRSKCDPKIM